MSLQNVSDWLKAFFLAAGKRGNLRFRKWNQDLGFEGAH